MTGIKTAEREIEIDMTEFDKASFDVKFDYEDNEDKIQKIVEKLGLCTQKEVVKDIGLGPTATNRLLHRLGEAGRIVQKKAKVRRSGDPCYRIGWVYLSIAEAKKRHIKQTGTK